MVARNDLAQSAKYELMVYLVGHGVKELSALVAIRPDEAAEKFTGAGKEILETLTKYVKAARKRIESKGYLFPGVGSHKHASKAATVNGLRKYLAKKGMTFDSLGLITSTRERRLSISTAEDALAFLEDVQRS